MPPSMGYSQKSRIVAGVFGIILGNFGIHNFYLGYVSRGLIQLLGTFVGGTLTCGLAAVGIWIWALIEGISILMGRIRVDANGVFLCD
ncbi:MAG: TM2 domain-containing protein [Clostridia bacterium]|nr:TM2 domain-containing protein [Clostridia bacterium]